MSDTTIEIIEPASDGPALREAGGPWRPTEPDKPGWLRRSVLRYPDFRRFWIGAAGSNIGTFMEHVGVRWVLTDLATQPNWQKTGHPSATLMLGYLTAAQLAPMLILGIPGGLVADRIDRRRMLLTTQVLMMFIAGALTTVSWLDMATPWVLMLLSVLHGVTMAFNVPAWQVMTPRLVPREELGHAIALNSLAFNLARVVGPLAAGVLLSVMSGRATLLFVINTLSFLGVIFAVMRTSQIPIPATRRPQEPWPIAAWHETREAVAFVFHRRGPRAVFIGVVLFAVLAGPVLPMLPLFSKEVYGRGEAGYGVLLALMGVGACVGAWMLHHVPKWYPRHHLIPLSISAGALAILLFCAVRSFWLGAALLPIIGLFWVWSFSSSIAAMQLLVGDEMRGRVMAVTNTAVFGGSPLGALMVGGIGEVVVGRGGGEGLAAQVGMAILAALLLLAGLVMLAWRTPEVDGARPGDPGYARHPGLLRGITASAHRPRERGGAGSGAKPGAGSASDEESKDEPIGVV